MKLAIVGVVLVFGLTACSAQGLRDALGGAGRGAASWGAQQQASPPAPIRPARLFKHSYVSGLNRICIYDTAQGVESLTVPAASVCPMN